MKKIVIVVLALAGALALTACGAARFDGSRTGNDSQLILEYRVFNGRDAQNLNLSAGDVLQGDVVSDRGSLSVTIQRDGDEPVYQGESIPTGTFEVAIPADGTYRVTVAGENARGRVSIVKAG